MDKSIPIASRELNCSTSYNCYPMVRFVIEIYSPGQQSLESFESVGETQFALYLSMKIDPEHKVVFSEKRFQYSFRGIVPFSEFHETQYLNNQRCMQHRGYFQSLQQWSSSGLVVVCQCSPQARTHKYTNTHCPFYNMFYHLEVTIFLFSSNQV